MKNALAYARVSTKEQAEKGLSIPAQLKAIREYASSHSFRILEEYSPHSADTPNTNTFSHNLNPKVPISFCVFL
jgi:hypothetical protein